MKRLLIIAPLVLAACSESTSSPLPLPSGSLAARIHVSVEGFVDVSAGVRLEYLDFGGTGDPVILLAGLGNTAHVFDDFAPRLTAHFHVIALTRRGFGASSQPASGYDTHSLAEDIRVVLDSLHLARASLVGHSLAGDEMTHFAGSHPERVAKLVYLDAAYDRVALGELLAANPVPAPPEPTAADLASFRAFSRYVARVRGARLPDSELRASYLFAPNGSPVGIVSPPEVTLAILQGEEHPNYADVRAPALGIFAVATNAGDFSPWLTPASADWDTTQALLSTVFGPFDAAQRARFAAEVTGSRVLALEGANHYVFISDPGRVAKAVLDFLQSP